MDSARRAEIQALLDAATPGPWMHDDQMHTNGNTYIRQVRQPGARRKLGIGVCIMNQATYNTDTDAALIAAAPTIIAELLAENERLQRALAVAVVIATTETQTY